MSMTMRTLSRAAALAAAALLSSTACDDDAADGDDYPVDTDTDSVVTSLIDDDIAAKGPLLDLDGAWTPQGKWGAEGDLGGDGGGYLNSLWTCLICDEPQPAVTAQVLANFALELAERAERKRALEPEDDATVLYVSADDSNSQSSPTAVRQRILAGLEVPGDLLRVWEFLNYYDFAYDEPVGGKALAVTAQLRPYDVEEGIYALQLGIQGKHVDEIRRQLNLTWSVDSSGSMSGRSIGLSKETMRAMAAHFRSGDVISMVGWNTEQNVWLNSYSVTGPNDPTVLAAIDAIEAGGSTDLNSGLISAYELANTNFIENGMNRVVLISDGGANVGVTDADLIAEEAAGGESEAIYLVGVGVGNEMTYNDELMDTVTDLGKGASVFVDSAAEAHRAFEDNFLSNIEMVAHDVQIQLTLPPTFEMYQFLGEEYSENAAEVEPQHMGPNDAMIVQQLIKTTEPKDVSALAEIGVHVAWTDAFTGLDDTSDNVWTLQELVNADADQLRKGDAIVVYVQTLGRIWDAIAESGSWSEALDTIGVECEWGEQVLDDAIDALGDPDLADVRALLDYYCWGLLDG
jgi:Ca-activated chloride channel homolog